MGARPDIPTRNPIFIIAATALHYGLTVVSRDTSDFTKARVPVLNPWRDADAG